MIKRFLLWVLSPALGELKEVLEDLERRVDVVEAQTTSICAEIACLQTK